MAAAIDHPNVIPVYAAGEDKGRLYLVMRWVQGTDLQALIARAGRLDPVRAASIVAQAGAGLGAAHAAGLVHRDVKPANVLIAGDAATGHVYLSDFGLTHEVSSEKRVTEAGEWIGTVDFMAPEQFDGGDATARTDVYALGCVLHAALTGRPPFPRKTVTATMLAHLRDPPPRPSATASVPGDFDAVVACALAKRPRDRYASAAELIAAAREAVDLPLGQSVRGATRRAAGNGRASSPSVAAAGSPPVAPARTTIPLRDGPARPAPRLRQPPPTARLSRSRRQLIRPARIAAMVAVAGGLAIGAALGAGSLGQHQASGPLTEADVRGTVEGFAEAYAGEDSEALARVLARDVARVTPGEVQRGRGTVLREYRRQFASNGTRDYVLQELEVRAGAAGRASGRYAVSRTRGAPITGRIAFGLGRRGGRPVIELIAATPDA